MKNRSRRLDLSRRMAAAAMGTDGLATTESGFPASDRPGKRTPLHMQIRQEIGEQIVSGRWPAGSVLPNENKLAETLGVSVGTLRRALVDLAADGLITRHPKIGTTVTGRTPPLGLQDSFKYFRLHGPGDTLAGAQSTNFGYELRMATPKEASILLLPPQTLVHKFERVRRLDGVPLMRDHVVFAQALVPDIHSVEDIPPTLAIHFMERYGIRITAQRERLSASLANGEDRRILEREGDFAVLVIEELAFDKLGKPILMAYHRAITDNFKYLNEVS